MASAYRTCPRCKTSNPRARNNCQQCGAVMLGVEAADVDDLLRFGGPGPVSLISPEFDSTAKSAPPVRPAAAAKPASSAANAGCAGCLVKLLLPAVIGLGGAVVFLEDNRDSELGAQVNRWIAELKQEFSHRRPAAPVVVPIRRPVLPLPSPPAPPPVVAPAVAPQPPPQPAEPPVSPRAAQLRVQLNAANGELLGCFASSLLVPSRLELQVSLSAGGAVTRFQVLEPKTVSPRARVCLRRRLADLHAAPDTAAEELFWQSPVAVLDTP